MELISFYLYFHHLLGLVDLTYNQLGSALGVIPLHLNHPQPPTGIPPPPHPYMGINRYLLPQNNGNLTLTFSGVNYPIVLLDKFY